MLVAHMRTLKIVFAFAENFSLSTDKVISVGWAANCCSRTNYCVLSTIEFCREQRGCGPLLFPTAKVTPFSDENKI